MSDAVQDSAAPSQAEATPADVSTAPENTSEAKGTEDTDMTDAVPAAASEDTGRDATQLPETRITDAPADIAKEHPTIQASPAVAAGEAIAPVATTDVPTAIADPAAAVSASSEEAPIPEDKPQESQPSSVSAVPKAVTAVAAATASQPMSRATSVANCHDAIAEEVGKAPVREYLQERVADWLLHGMKWLAVNKPSQPLLVLGEYLELAHYWRSASSARETQTPHDFEAVWLKFRMWQTVPENKGKPAAAFDVSR
ncbi:hypothetical protein BCR37DRAFT_21015 [Protomyces lactucae-debilis]|uniref:Uncharacterized protein n=1 Tax=Protomyces lactucae-debilis TaxID=2754530 RepID=A0A1Y2FD68_PROLT|nr:uncharacterized protein BCR37DRAFT_21015 [Protomyces lactucae-debilis]ORY81870.1 hypothetical protein BCR37DRAFT_21015 [Protomyces lactucae-debilis]